MRYLLLLVPLLFAGCHHRCALVARSEYLNPSYLASSKIGTPDPCTGCFTGEQIVVSWNVSQRCLPANLKLRLRYGNREFQEVIYPICNPRGYWIYRVMNKDYWKLQGILSYSVEIESEEGEILGRWNHHLWAEQVEILDMN